jgi:hypothetical protein
METLSYITELVPAAMPERGEDARIGGLEVHPPSHIKETGYPSPVSLFYDQEYPGLKLDRQELPENAGNTWIHDAL